jgi:hypothetical protein
MGLEGWDIPEAAYVASLCLLKETLLPQIEKQRLATYAARAVISSAPKDLSPAGATDRA